MPLHHPKEKEKKRKIKLLVFKYPITMHLDIILSVPSSKF